MLGFYNYTVILTYFGMLIGFSGITCVLEGNRKGALAFRSFKLKKPKLTGKIRFLLRGIVSML